jgi:plasmid stabilization system protein ParE
VRHVIRPPARDDMIRQYRHYLLQHAFDAAIRFLDAVDESIEYILRMPESGSPRSFKKAALSGLRTWPVAGFEDVRIYYFIRGAFFVSSACCTGNKIFREFSLGKQTRNELSRGVTLAIAAESPHPPAA